MPVIALRVNPRRGRQGVTVRKPEASTRLAGLTYWMIHVPGVSPSFEEVGREERGARRVVDHVGRTFGLATPLALISIMMPVPSTGARARPTATIGAPAFTLVDLSATA